MNISKTGETSPYAILASDSSRFDDKDDGWRPVDFARAESNYYEESLKYCNEFVVPDNSGCGYLPQPPHLKFFPKYEQDNNQRLEARTHDIQPPAALSERFSKKVPTNSSCEQTQFKSQWCRITFAQRIGNLLKPSQLMSGLGKTR